MLERIGEEIEKMLGGKGRQEAAAGGTGAAEGVKTTATVPPVAAHSRPLPTLAERREELDGLLRLELERQGIVVTGQDIGRVVGTAVGKRIAWQA